MHLNVGYAMQCIINNIMQKIISAWISKISEMPFFFYHIAVSYTIVKLLQLPPSCLHGISQEMEQVFANIFPLIDSSCITAYLQKIQIKNKKKN